MNKKQSVELINILRETYPDATCSLDFENPFELVVAVMLSAQCTDERVNKTTPSIFEKYKTPEDFANIEICELEKLIHPCGFYKTKAKNIKATSTILVTDYNSKVPENIEDLIKLPGVGRKTANVVMLEAFNNPQGIAVDTHAKRSANRIGLSKKVDPLKIELDLLKTFPKEYYKDINHILIYHGRNTCTARNPKCETCTVKQFCKNYSKNV